MYGNKPGVYFITDKEMEQLTEQNTEVCSKCGNSINTLCEGYSRFHGNILCHDCALTILKQ